MRKDAEITLQIPKCLKHELKHVQENLNKIIKDYGDPEMEYQGTDLMKDAEQIYIE